MIGYNEANGIHLLLYFIDCRSSHC